MAKNAVEFGQSLVSRWGRPARLVTVAILALLLLIAPLRRPTEARLQLSDVGRESPVLLPQFLQ